MALTTTISAVSNTVSQQIIRPTTVTVHHDTSSVPSVESNTIVDNVAQQSQGMYVTTYIEYVHRYI